MQAIVSVLNHNLTSTEKWVLTILASFTNYKGRNGYPSAEGAAAVALVNERTIRRIRKGFFESGVLEKVGNKIGGRGRFVEYRFNPNRALELHYRGKIPDWVKNLLSGAGNPKSKKAGSEPGSSNKKPGYKSEKVGAESEKADSVPGKSINEPVNKSLYAQAGMDAIKRPPACAVWKAHLEEIREYAGEKDFKSFIEILIPDLDDRKTLTLLVPTRFLKDYIDGRFLHDLERILDRKVVLKLGTPAGRG